MLRRRSSLRARTRRDGRPRRRAAGPVAALVAALLASAALSGVGAVGPAAAAPADGDQPLRVSLDALTPAVVPARGPVRMSGTIANTTDDPWTDVRVYAFSGTLPILTRAALEEAVATDPAAEVGGRTTQDGTYDEIELLAPGERRRWSLRVPRALLDVPADVPGVYWMGVHALGTSVDGRDGFADGRARTFVPAIPRVAPPVPVSLVVPVRRPVEHEADGSVADVETWVTDLAPGGSLRALLDLGTAGGFRPLTWLVDPAVLDAVRRLAAGNPGRSLAPTMPPEDRAPADGPSASAAESPPPSLEPAPSPSGSGSPTGDGGPDAPAVEPPTPLERQAATLADAWLTRATRLMSTADVVLLPYGDLDVAAAVHRAPHLLRRATALSAATAAELRLDAAPAAAPVGGSLDAATLRGLPDGTVVLLEPGALPDDAPAVDTMAGHTVVQTDPGAAAGGPGPDAPMATVAVRQRLLAETALATMATGDGDPDPVVAVLSPRWRPEDGLGFFAGLDDAPWLQLRALTAMETDPTTVLEPDALVYPERLLRQEVPTRNLEAVSAAVRAGELLESVLVRNDRVGSVVARASFVGASYAARHRPLAWRRVAARTEAAVVSTLGGVSVEAPEAVTLSSESGGFPATVVNELAEPVRVRVEVRTSSPMTVTAPSDIALEPGERTSVLLTASTTRIGLHEVELVLTSADGVPLGSSDTVRIRSAQVSWIIWVVVAASGTLLLGAIVVRLVRRVRAARRRPEGAA